jgi:hypothetical protein
MEKRKDEKHGAFFQTKELKSYRIPEIIN